MVLEEPMLQLVSRFAIHIGLKTTEIQEPNFTVRYNYQGRFTEDGTHLQGLPQLPLVK